jgi:HSP20 family protein
MAEKPEKSEKPEKGREKGARTPALWDPFRELETFFDDWRPLEFSPRFRRLLEQRPAVFAPAIDVHEGDKEYVVTAEVPGVARNEITVEVDEGMLTLRGEKKTEREEKKERRRWVERSYGAFSRSFRLPSDAQVDRIDASFKDGVLTIKIPKSEARKPRTVSVKG